MKTKIAMLRRADATTRTSLVAAIVVGLAGVGAICASAATTGAGTFVTVAHPTVLRQGDALMGAMPMRQPIHVTLALKPRDKEGLDVFVANAASNQAKGVMTPAMTSAQFLERHAPSQQQAQAVADYLTRSGFTNVLIAPNRLLVSADGTASNARSAFMTTLAQVRAQDGRIAYANTEEVWIPASLDDKVFAVIGLQTVHQAHTFARRLDPNAVHTHAITGHLPTAFPSIYGASTAAAASNVTVGIITEGSLTQTRADLATFATERGLAPIVTSTINTDGTSSDTAGTPEWDLDSQDVVGMAGGTVKSLIFYNIPNLSDATLTDDFNKVVSKNMTKIINVSLGLCETDAQSDGSAAAEDLILETAVAQGQTFSVSTGDSGADECGNGTNTPSWPAASQYVVAAAGTRLNASTTTWTSESVWTDSGGSQSTFEPKPSWQTSFGVPGTRRVVADIAFDADPSSGSKIVVGGVLSQYGGTSLSAPLFAGLWARVLQTNPTIGFAGPIIYALQAADFHDITVGKNSGGETGVGSNAKVGYDFASGRGSMMIDSVVSDIVTNALGNKKPVTNYTFVATGLSVSFTDTSTDPEGSTLTHAWGFGDGTSSTATNPVHVYAAAGTYSVKETVKDRVGAVGTRTRSVTVN